MKPRSAFLTSTESCQLYYVHVVHMIYPVINYDEERTELWLRQTEHIRGHLWHIYSITVIQVMAVTVKLSKWCHQLNHETSKLFSCQALDLTPLLIHSCISISVSLALILYIWIARFIQFIEFQVVKLMTSLRKFYCHRHDLNNRYGIYVSQMTTDMFRLS
jgi:hypothetical protein